MITRKQFDEALAIVEEYKRQIEQELLEVTEKMPNNNNWHVSKDTLLRDTNLSNRAVNSLNKLGLCWGNKISCLENYSKRELSHIRGCGINTIEEIEDLCLKAGVKLKK